MKEADGGDLTAQERHLTGDGYGYGTDGTSHFGVDPSDRSLLSIAV